MNDFEKKYQGTTKRPECYGDEDYYDPADAECQACEYKTTCSVIVRRRANQARQRTTDIRSTTKKKLHRSEYREVPYEDPSQDTSFQGALGHNASVNGVQALADTFAEAMRSIPRLKYPNPFRRKKE
tara:strand:- start:927 stop:1307 length:381 start_codon:yes stop_codon:yes gene_type:complete